jgi:hypothetical protein
MEHARSLQNLPMSPTIRLAADKALPRLGRFSLVWSEDR